ncbi:MAG: DUF6159 family protein [Thermomonas sp.]
MGKFARSWALAKASMSVLRSDKELLLFPLLSGLGVALVAATFLLPLFGLGMLDHVDRSEGVPAGFYVLGFAFYLVQYFVVFFFTTALVGAAMVRLDGGDPTVGTGLRIAAGKWVSILGYAAIAATVGMILRGIKQRAGIVGRIVVGFVGVAWTLATFLTVPVLVAQDVGPVEAVKESATLLKRTWGEGLIGNGGIGLVGGLAAVAVMVVALALLTFLARAGLGGAAVGVLALSVLAVVGIGLVQSALGGIYSAALYRYAIAGEAPAGFDGALLQDAFRRKG